MDSVKVNIDSYDENTHSILVHFTGIENGVEYSTEKYAFNTSNYDTSSLDEIVKKLAQTGLAYLNQLAAKQKIANDANLIEQLKTLNNTSHSFNVEDLIPPAVEPINTGIADNLEIQI